MIRLLAAPALLAASAAQADFSPPLDRPITVTRTQTRTVGPVTVRFVAERRIVFRAAGPGYAADVTLVAARSEGDPRHGFEATLAGLKGRPLRFWLDAQGSLLSIEDMDAAWTAWTAGLPAALRTARVPPERQRAILSSALTQLIQFAAPEPGSRPIRVPVATVGGHGDPLTGFEQIVAEGPTRRRATARATGPVRLPAASGGGQATADIVRERVFDIATGLVVDDLDTATTTSERGVITTVTQTELKMPVF